MSWTIFIIALVLVISGIIWFFVESGRDTGSKSVDSRLDRFNSSAFIGMVVLFVIFYLGNIHFGNIIGIEYLLSIGEATNGDAQMAEWLYSPWFLIVINLLVNGGQWARWRFDLKGWPLVVSYLLNFLDAGLNVIGFYTAWRPFTPPINFAIVAVCSIGHGVVGVYAQHMFQEMASRFYRTARGFEEELPEPEEKQKKDNKKEKNSKKKRGRGR